MKMNYNVNVPYNFTNELLSRKDRYKKKFFVNIISSTISIPLISILLFLILRWASFSCSSFYLTIKQQILFLILVYPISSL